MNIIIVGANTGIGFELAKLYSKQGHHVLAFNRSESKELDSLDNVEVLSGLDLLDDQSYVKVSDHLKGKSIDLLIHNAGVFQTNELQDLDFSSIELQLKINSIAPLKFIHQALPFMKEGSKIGITTSQMGSMGDNSSGGFYGYRMSKAAVNAVGKSLSHDLKDRKISVALLHPGYVRTRMTDGSGNINPDESAEGLVKVLENLNLENTGSFWNYRQEQVPW